MAEPQDGREPLTGREHFLGLRECKKNFYCVGAVCILGVYLCKCVERAFWGLFVTTAKPSLP